MIYEQFIVSLVELIMLSWQSYNYHNMRVTWLFCDFFKLQIHILQSLENISILIFGNCDLSDVTFFGETSQSFLKISEARRFPL